FHCHLAEAACDRYRILAAGQEARRVAGESNEIRLRKTAREAAFLQRVDQDVDGRAARNHAAQEEAERRAPGEHTGTDFANPQTGGACRSRNREVGGAPSRTYVYDPVL